MFQRQSTSSAGFVNPSVDRTNPGLFRAEEYARVEAYFRSRTDLGPTPLRHLPNLAARLGIGTLLVKDESTRFGLNAFKIAGVAYAVARLLETRALPPEAVLVAATAGNHGRALARVARQHGLVSRIYVPRDTLGVRIDALRHEGADVVVSEGDYEQAVREADRDAGLHGWTVVSDTAWPGYEEIPRWVMAGYTWIVREAFEQCGPAERPDCLIVQGGVGGLVCATASWVAYACAATRPATIAAEPAAAACLLESARHGRPTRLASVGPTMMAVLRCAEVSPLAWQGIAATTDAFVAITDAHAAAAMRLLRVPAGDDPIVVSGASGACGLGALLAMLEDPSLGDIRQRLGLGSRSRVLVFNTEGATDPELYARVTGRVAS